MLKFILGLVGLIPLVFITGSWNIVMVGIFIFSFLFTFYLPYIGLFNFTGYSIGLDILSYGLILLSFWICALIILASQRVNKSNYYSSLFVLMVVFLLIILYLTFTSINLFLFYLYFEGSLIPTLLLILG